MRRATLVTLGRRAPDVCRSAERFLLHFAPQDQTMPTTNFQQHTSHFLESRFRRSLVYFSISRNISGNFHKEHCCASRKVDFQLRHSGGLFNFRRWMSGHVCGTAGSAEIWARRAVGMNFEENRPFWAVTGVTISRAQPTEHRKLMPGVPPGRGD